MTAFEYLPAQAPKVPIILSIPHCGTHFPHELEALFESKQRQTLDDTDWYLQQLYDFAPALGICTVFAHYSRWVVDLNRDANNQKLYDDGRIQTQLTPTHNFHGEKLYKDGEYEPNEGEVLRRKQAYYTPYHQQIQQLLEQRLRQFGQVLLWDAHSIRHYLPLIQNTSFPEMILGNNDERSCGQRLIHRALRALKNGGYQVAHNRPFKGGAITRKYGKPQKNIHSLQLEMNKNLYMDDSERDYDPQRAARLKHTLEQTFIQLIEAMKDDQDLSI